MKKIILLTFFLIYGLQSHAVVDINANWSETPEVKLFSPEMTSSKMDLEEFLSMTPRKIRKKTGKRLGIKKSLQLKAAQRTLKKKMRKMKKMKKAGDGDISSGLYVLLAILGLGWVAMGVMDDWSGKNWITNIILTVLCWLPGLIHALAKKKDYY